MYKLRDFLTLTFDLLTLGSRHMMRFGCSIALFAGKYRELYTCESYNEGDMQRIIQDVNNMVTEENSSGCFRFQNCCWASETTQKRLMH